MERKTKRSMIFFFFFYFFGGDGVGFGIQDRAGDGCVLWCEI
jgi:hypothetical protein